MNRDLAIARAVGMQPDFYRPLRKRGCEMSPGCKTQPSRGGLGCAWERACRDTRRDKVDVPAVAGPSASAGLALAEEGGEILGVAATLLHHLDLQNVQFCRGIKSTQKSEVVCDLEPCCPQKSLFSFRGPK